MFGGGVSPTLAETRQEFTLTIQNPLPLFPSSTFTSQSTLYEGGFFKAKLKFPSDFPNMPPEMTFVSEMWHPNVYEGGKVCISILHPPGEDAYNSQESADERWRPILGVEQIIISVISMLSDPNDESPANLDAAVQWRNDLKGFKRRVRQVIQKSQE